LCFCNIYVVQIVSPKANILSKMEKMVSDERGICELEAFQYGEKGRAEPLFHTWPTHQFGMRKKGS